MKDSFCEAARLIEGKATFVKIAVLANRTDMAWGLTRGRSVMSGAPMV
jgi:hypothetical protein